MLLTFSKTEFMLRVIGGVKIHSIREDKHSRWKKGMKIHFWMHNPRNVKKNPFQFAEGVVSEIYYIKVLPNIDEIMIADWVSDSGDTKHWFPYNKPVVLEFFAKNDGFESWKEMKEFFPEKFEGRIIYWKDLKIIK